MIENPDLVILDNRIAGPIGDELQGKLDPRIPKELITGDLQVEPLNQFKQIIRILSQLFNVDEVDALFATWVASRRKYA